MKKKLMTILLLAAAFVLALTPVLAQEGDEIEASVLPAEGWVADGLAGTVWQDDRASLEIMFNEGSGLTVFIMWASSAWEHTEWTYTCTYDAETDTLIASHLICDEVAYDEDGAVTRTGKIDVDCETVFSLNEEDRLVIQNAADESLEGKIFTPIGYDAGEAVG